MSGQWAGEQERRRAAEVGLADLDTSVLRIIERVRPFTLTSPERIAALCAAVDYAVDNGIPGTLVECGVWKGGSLMAAAMRLLDRGFDDRRLVGFDTFAGMTAPSPLDVDYEGKPWVGWIPPGKADPGAHLTDVKEALRTTGYPEDQMQLIVGDVADTLPANSPDEIAILRLDTDWYESTRHELEHLYPHLVVGGVLIVDDYGHYEGARKAVDEYLSGQRIFLHRVDYTGRIATKQHAIT